MQSGLPIPLRKLGLVGLVVACGREGSAHESAAPPSSIAPQAAAPADSLVLRTPSGTEVWLTLAREDRDSTGQACLERTLEIRAGDRRVTVPLLYTRDIPRLVDESTMSARIWSRCTPGDLYRINLRTGQPVRSGR